MTEKEWDEKLKNKIWDILINFSGFHAKTNTVKEVLAIIRKDRKHQKSEMLKRLPSIGDMYNCFEVIWKRNCKKFRKGTNQENVDYSYAVAQEIHKLAEDKLK